jgi:prevent-host-death family protein
MYYTAFWPAGAAMKTVSARQANQQFSALLSKVEGGETLVITKRGDPVALLTRYEPAEVTSDRKKAIERAVKLMTKGLTGAFVQQFLTRER